MMYLIWWNEDYIARANFSPLIVTNDQALSIQYEDFMFPIMSMVGRVPTGSHLKATHGKVLCTVVFRYQPSDFGSLGTLVCHYISPDL